MMKGIKIKRVKKALLYSLVLCIVLAVPFFVSSCGREKSRGREDKLKEVVDYYTCGMHPDVKISPEEYESGSRLCPICNMALIPVEAKKEKIAEHGQKQEKVYYGCGVDTDGRCPYCDSGEPDGKCICGEHSFVIMGEKMNCPICKEPLKELTRGEADKYRAVAGRVKIKGEQSKLAGVRTESVEKRHLYQKIRAVGKVAYDPDLFVAEEEYISSLNAVDKISAGNIPGIKERAQGLVESSARKLRLLGLSGAQIEELGKTRKAHRNLILPEEKMWVYGEVYEYELPWIKEGEEVIVTASGVPGEKFKGTIVSINPVVDPKTRSVKFRTEVKNPGLKLKPEMYIDILIHGMYVSPSGSHMVLAVPKDAVLDTGIRKIVWVDEGKDEYEGRLVEVGPETIAEVNGKEIKFYPVLRGLYENENVVTKANFLIDSQSQITGQASSAYGGSLSGGQDESGSMPPGHQH